MLQDTLALQRKSTKMVPIGSFADFVSFLGVERAQEREVEPINDETYGKPPAYPEAGQEEDNSFKVECSSCVPRIRERFHTFHGAYLYAYKEVEGRRLTLEIAHDSRDIMRVGPDNLTHFYGK